MTFESSENSGDDSGGCELPEDLRRYYLDAMGIQVWKEVAEPVQAHESELWSKLEQAVQSCCLCPLHESRTQTVFGVGNKNAELLVIGEAPGRDEDLKGEPFVGPAGQLLTAMLKAIDLKREDVFIANILKCRPPNNRNPEPSEIESCNPYLRQQIALIQPKVIFAVGRIAAQALLNTTNSISSMRGKLHSYEGVPLIASYHPAYLLRKPTEKRKAWQDLLQLKKVMEECQ
jgi:DNA polymerase